ncbi:MAG: nicotinate-nicotinamide nucleotide adenylyltransferase [Victivallales bacterium]|nr:nicotinate-nicotinamide nucleotide adenylyltransferase [Victivallales bacterium]
MESNEEYQQEREREPRRYRHEEDDYRAREEGREPRRFHRDEDDYRGREEGREPRRFHRDGGDFRYRDEEREPRRYRREEGERRPREEEELPELEPVRKWRLSVFGGTFDPIHNGHLQIVSQILYRGLTDEVLFVPTFNPLKEDAPVAGATGEARLEMIRLALEAQGEDTKARLEELDKEWEASSQDETLSEVSGQKSPKEIYEEKRKGLEALRRIGFSDMELSRRGRVYTYDTMNLMNKIYPDCDLSFIIGMDSLCSLAQWYRAPELVQRAQFLIYPRPGVVPPSFLELSKTFGSRNANRLLESILPDNFALSGLSATGIRRAVQGGNWEEVSRSVPPSVLEYIQSNHLYQ